jgi:hypothetical protein
MSKHWFNFHWNNEARAPDSPPIVIQKSAPNNEHYVNPQPIQQPIKQPIPRKTDFISRTTFYLLFFGLLLLAFYVIYHHFYIEP